MIRLALNTQLGVDDSAVLSLLDAPAVNRALKILGRAEKFQGYRLFGARGHAVEIVTKPGRFNLWTLEPVKEIGVATSEADAVAFCATGWHRGVNAAWHEANRMPRDATPDEKRAWHEEHQRECACRPAPSR